MSCAQFPPDNKLCFMAASALSIPSQGTFCFEWSASPLVARRLPRDFLFSLAASKNSAALDVGLCIEFTLRLRFIKCCGRCGSSSNICHAGLGLDPWSGPTAPQILGLPPRLRSFLARQHGLDRLQVGGVRDWGWGGLLPSRFTLQKAIESLASRWSPPSCN